MAAALLHLLPRRRAATTLALLIPASMSSCSISKPPYPLRAVTAAGVLRPDARRAQLCASPVPPSMLRLYASEGCARPAPRQPAHRQATCRLHKLRFPPQASAAISTILPGSRRMQLSHLLVPSLTRHFSGMGNVLPPLRKLIDPQSMWYLKVLGLAVFLLMVSNWIQIWRLYVGRQYSQHGAFMLWFLDKAMNDLREQIETMNEALEILEIAVHLLEHGLDDKASFVFDQGMDTFLKANDICEKVLLDSVKAIGSCEDFTLATREHHRLLCKEVEDCIKMLRQRLKKLSDSFETLKTLRKNAKESIPVWMGMGSQGLEDV